MQEPRPQIAELLRTCVHPPSLLLQVAYVEVIDVKQHRHDQRKPDSESHEQHYDEDHRFTLKFVLTDGKLMIQALLHRKLSGLRDAADVAVGDLLDIRNFTVKKSAKLSGQGHVVYLAIEDCHFLLQPFTRNQEVERIEREPAAEKARKRRRESLHCLGPSTSDFLEEDETAGGFLRPSPVKRHRLEDLELGGSLDEEDKVDLGLQTAACGSLDRPTPTTIPTNWDNTMLGMSPKTFTAQDSPNGVLRRSFERRSGKNRLGSTLSASSVLSGFENDDDDDDDNWFEEANVNLVTVKKRREALQKFDSNILLPVGPLLEGTLCIDPETAKSTAKPASAQRPAQHSPSVLQTTSETMQTELQQELHSKLKEHFAEPSQRASKECDMFALPRTLISVPQQRTVKTAQQAGPAPSSASIQATLQTLLPAPPFHTLRSLRNPPLNQPLPSKNYALTTLAFISWTGTSLIHRPGSPFPPKRHLKIIDPSLSSSRPPSRDDQLSRQLGSSSFAAQTAFQDAVTVAVYIDATNFKPGPGTLALVRGLVMQRLANGDIILNAYGRLKDQRFDGPQTTVSSSVGADAERSMNMNVDTHWFITNEAKIRALGYGSKYDYYREWWKEKQQTNHSAQS